MMLSLMKKMLASLNGNNAPVLDNSELKASHNVFFKVLPWRASLEDSNDEQACNFFESVRDHGQTSCSWGCTKYRHKKVEN